MAKIRLGCAHSKMHIFVGKEVFHRMNFCHITQWRPRCMAFNIIHILGINMGAFISSLITNCLACFIGA